MTILQMFSCNAIQAGCFSALYQKAPLSRIYRLVVYVVAIYRRLQLDVIDGSVVCVGAALSKLILKRTCDAAASEKTVK